MPKISVIIPVYKVEEYLNRCVDSVINQTYKDFEIILVDDGSPDNCGKICDEYAARYSFVTVIHKENGGLSDARNAGLDVMRGEYVAFVDSDDYIHPEYLNILITEAEKHNADIAVCNYAVKRSLQPEFDAVGDYRIEGFDSRSAIIKFLTCKKTWEIISACVKIYRYRVFDNLRFPKGRMNEDNFTTWKCYLNSERIVQCFVPLYCIYPSENSITRQAYSIKNLDALAAAEEMAEVFKNTDSEIYHLANDLIVRLSAEHYYKVKNNLNDNKLCRLLKKKILSIARIGATSKPFNIKNYESAFIVAHPISAELYFKKIAFERRFHFKKGE